MSEEVGELSSLVKHELWCDEQRDLMSYAKELGDLLWYLMALSTVLGIDFDTVAELNVAKIAHRYPERQFDVVRSSNRHNLEQEFEHTEVYQKLYEKIHLEGE